MILACTSSLMGEELTVSYKMGQTCWSTHTEASTIWGRASEKCPRKYPHEPGYLNAEVI